MQWSRSVKSKTEKRGGGGAERVEGRLVQLSSVAVNGQNEWEAEQSMYVHHVPSLIP